MIAAAAVAVATVSAGGGHSQAAARYRSGAAVRGQSGAAANRAAAQRDAAELLTRVVLPPGASRLNREPAGDHGYLEPQSALESDTAREVAHAWWQVRGAPTAAIAFVQAHHPAAATVAGTGTAGDTRTGASASMIFFQWPALAGVLGLRTVRVTATSLGAGRTGVLIESQSDWIVPRPVTERIPPSVARVDITSGAPGAPPSVSLSVTGRGRVRRILNLINGLPIAQPITYGCPVLFDPRVIIMRFRTSAGRTLAVLTYDDFRPWSSPSAGCKTVGLTIADRPQTPLLGGSFLHTLAQLLARSLI
jgi:hypothetical protein